MGQRITGAIALIIGIVTSHVSSADIFDVVAGFNNTGTQPASGNPFTYGTETSLNVGFALFRTFKLMAPAQLAAASARPMGLWQTITLPKQFQDLASVKLPPEAR